MSTEQKNRALLTPFERLLDSLLSAVHYCVVISSLLYVTLLAYLSESGKIIWILGALPLGGLLYFLARLLQRAIETRLGYAPPIYDSMKETKEYFSFRRTIPMLVVSLLFGLLAYLIAFLIRQNYALSLEHDAYMDPYGFVYELLFGIITTLSVYGAAISKLFPDELWYSHESQPITFVLPVLILLMSVFYFGVPFLLALVFLVIYFLSLFVRDLTYDHMLKKRQLEHDKKEMREGTYLEEEESPRSS